MLFGRILHFFELAKNRVILLTILAVACAGALACSTSDEESASTFPTSAVSVREARSGQEIFSSVCAICHGSLGEGQPNWHIHKADGTLPPPPLNGDGHTWHHSDGFLYKVVKDGGKWMESPSLPHFKSGMPAFGEQLSHEEIISALAYVKSLWGDKMGRGMYIREWQAELSLNDPFPAGP